MYNKQTIVIYNSFEYICIIPVHTALDSLLVFYVLYCEVCRKKKNVFLTNLKSINFFVLIKINLSSVHQSLLSDLFL